MKKSIYMNVFSHFKGIDDIVILNLPQYKINLCCTCILGQDCSFHVDFSNALVVSSVFL